MSEERRPAMPGPLAPFATGFRARLSELGYVSSGLRQQVGLFAHLDRWLASAGLSAADVTSSDLDRFLTARAAQGHTTKLTAHGLTQVVEFLAELGIDARPVAPATAADRLLARFGRHLAEERAGPGNGAQLRARGQAVPRLLSRPA